MAILSPAEIQDLRDEIAPQGDESLVEVWRMQAANVPLSGGQGVDEFGMSLEEGTRADQQRVKVAEYPCRISRAGVGNEREFGEQMTNVVPWTVTFNWDDNPDIRGGDKLIEPVSEIVDGVRERVVWTANTVVTVGTLVQPTASNGRYYRCKVAGTTGSTQPTWPKTPKLKTVVDGSVTWEFVDYLRTLEVKDPGGETTYNVMRLVRCEEIKWGQ